jgi:hypothetical protein
MTAEDPVEFNLPASTSADERANRIEFALRCARSFAKDPNIVLVGEIRDFETAEIAIKAALTGTPRFIDAAHERRAFDDFPNGQYGHRAVSGRHQRQHHSSAETYPPHLRM